MHSFHRTTLLAFECFGRGHVFVFVTHQVFILFVTVATCLVVESRFVAEARATVEARFSNQTESNVKALLTVMCDAVVHVDRDMKIRKPCPQLAALVLRQQHPVNSEGQSLLDFVHADDQQRLQQQFLNSSPGPPLSLNVHLLDANSSKVEVQLFYTCFTDFTNQNAYVIGIRELQHGEGVVPQDNQYLAAETVRFAEHARALRLPGGEGAEALRQKALIGTSNASVSSWSSCECLQLSESLDDEVVAWFDGLSPNLQILRISAGFTLISGPSGSGANLKEWIVQADDFCYAVQCQLNAMFSSSEVPGLVEIGTVRLRPPAVKRAGFEFVATCVLDFPNLEDMSFVVSDDDDGGKVLPIRMILTNISQRQRKPSSKRHGARTSSGSRSSKKPWLVFV